MQIRETMPTTGKPSESNLPAATRQLSPDVLRKITSVRRVYGDQTKFLSKMNPSVQLFAGQNPERAFFGNAPTLVILNKTYGDGFAATWLLPQIYDLVVYCNSKSTLNDQQAEFLAQAIAHEYYFLKASEVLLFFYRFKLGQYGKFYGTVDPMAITRALDKFCAERLKAYDERDAEEEREWRDLSFKLRVKFEEYLQWKSEQNAQCPEN